MVIVVVGFCSLGRLGMECWVFIFVCRERSDFRYYLLVFVFCFCIN